MNIEQRKILRFRIISSLLLLLPIGAMVFSLLQIFVTKPEDMMLTVVALIACGAFNIFEIVVLMRGYTKESNLYKIAFNDNGNINNVPLVAVIVGTLFGLLLTSLGLVVFIVREETYIRASMLVVLTIGSYLLINCLVYYIFLIMYKKREINLRDFIK